MLNRTLADELDLKWPKEGAACVPYWVYTDPRVYAAEQERIFARSWNYVALEAEIPKAGDFVRSTVGDKSIIVTRDASGEIRAVANRCAHRGVEFCRQPHGNAPKFICPYHQWTYDSSGKLVGVPFRRGYNGKGGMPDDFDMKDHGLRTLKVAVRNGVIFASFDHSIESLEDNLGVAMLKYFDRVFDGRELEVLGHMRQRIPCNWKLMAENLKDPYHASVLHVFLITFGLFRLDQIATAEFDPTGRHAALTSRRGEQTLNAATAQLSNFKQDMKLRDARLLQPTKEFPGDWTVVMQTIFPNLIIQQQSNTLAMRQIVPRGPRHFDLNWMFFGYRDDTPEMRERLLRQANLMGPSGLVSVDDSEVLAMSQRGVEAAQEAQAIVEMSGRDASDTDHMITEAAIRGFYKTYIDMMDF